MNGDGSGKKQLTNDQSTKALASVSPDGRLIAFTSNRSGSINIWRMDIDGGNVKQLTDGALDDTPRISPDGKWVVFISRRSGTETLWKVPIDGGEPAQLSSKRAWGASISPNGKLIACILSDEGSGQTDRIGILPFEGGEFVKTLDLPPSAVSGLAWTPDGSAITYLDNGSGTTNIVSQPLDGGPVKPLTNFKSDMGYRISNFAWSRGPGKQQLIYSHGPFTVDILLIKDFR
jgi:Tol biopolymer transport system component